MQQNSIEAAIKARLERQLAEVEAKIVELEADKRALLRLIAVADQQEGGVVRKNGAQRIAVERAILDFLESTGREVPASLVLQHVRIVYRTLNDGTFRSYLHRLALRGTIAPGASRGLWRLSTLNSASKP